MNHHHRYDDEEEEEEDGDNDVNENDNDNLLRIAKPNHDNDHINAESHDEKL